MAEDTAGTGMKEGFRVLIIGAASTGLCVAQGLKKAGIPFTIFERSPHPSSEGAHRFRDWGMTVHWSAANFATLLPEHIISRLPEAQTNQQLDFSTITGWPAHNLATGEVLKEIPLTTPRRMSRKRLRGLLMTGLEEELQFGKELVDITYSDDGETVTAHFADNTTATGTILLGADGARSAVRTLLFPDDPTKAALSPPLPYTMFNTIVHYAPEHVSAIQAVSHPFAHFGYHPDGTFFWLSVMDNPSPASPDTCLYQVAGTWAGAPSAEDNASDATRLAALKRRVGGYASPFCEFVAWIPEGTPLPADRIATWDPVPYDTRGGRVCLAGDAAHVMTFHRGQGLNVAIEDAGRFVEAVKAVCAAGGGGREAVVGEYAREVGERGGAEVRLSRMSTELVHKWEELMRSPVMRSDVGVGKVKEGQGEAKEVGEAAAADAEPAKTEG